MHVAVNGYTRYAYIYTFLTFNSAASASNVPFSKQSKGKDTKVLKKYILFIATLNKCAIITMQSLLWCFFFQSEHKPPSYVLSI